MEIPEIRVSATSPINLLISEVAESLREKRIVAIVGINSSIYNAVKVVEIIKHSIIGLHQLNYFVETEDRNKTKCIFILSFMVLNVSHPGYESPIPCDQVDEKSLEELMKTPEKPKTIENQDSKKVINPKSNIASEKIKKQMENKLKKQQLEKKKKEIEKKEKKEKLEEKKKYTEKKEKEKELESELRREEQEKEEKKLEFEEFIQGNTEISSEKPKELYFTLNENEVSEILSIKDKLKILKEKMMSEIVKETQKSIEVILKNCKINEEKLNSLFESSFSSIDRILCYKTLQDSKFEEEMNKWLNWNNFDHRKMFTSLYNSNYIPINLVYLAEKLLKQINPTLIKHEYSSFFKENTNTLISINHKTKEITETTIKGSNKKMSSWGGGISYINSNEFYYIGGNGNLSGNYLINTREKTKRELKNLGKTNLCLSGTSFTENRLFVFGGYKEETLQPTPSTWELVNNNWIQRSEIPEALTSVVCSSSDDKILITAFNTSNIYEFDINLNSFKLVFSFGKKNCFKALFKTSTGDIFYLESNGYIFKSDWKNTQNWIKIPKQCENLILKSPPLEYERKIYFINSELNEDFQNTLIEFDIKSYEFSRFKIIN